MARRVGGFKRARTVTPGREMVGSTRSMPAQRDTGVIQMTGRPVFTPDDAPMRPRQRTQPLASAAVDYGLTPDELAAWRLQLARSMR